MSYLDLPRINFAGQFFTNVSTINNTLSNYPPGATIQPGWNPTGTAEFEFRNATVQGVAGADGSGLVGVGVTTPASPVAGKMVDIDPDFQQLTQVIGVTVKLSASSGAGFTATLDTCNFQDLWQPQPQGSGNAGCSQCSVIFVSVLSGVEWSGSDPALAALRAATADDTKLAIRFVIGSYFFADPGDDASGLGALLGTIGPLAAGDPAQFATRRMMPPAAAGVGPGLAHDALDQPQLQATFCSVDHDACRASIDLANALPIEGFGGPPADIGQLQAGVIADDGAFQAVGDPFPAASPTFAADGGIADVTLTPAACDALENSPLALQLQPSNGGPAILALSEARHGIYVNISPFTTRVVGGETAEFDLQAFQWGKPLGGLQLQLATRSSRGTPASLQVSGDGTAATGPDGRATFTVTAPSSLGIPPVRKELDSLAYEVTGPWTGTNGGQTAGQLPPACLLVFAPYADAGMPDPTWDGQVGPVLDEYARIYPGMKAILDIGDEATVRTHAQDLIDAMSLPFAAPHKMPVTRDLSPEKIEVILRWLQAQLPA